jgi:selenocysteine-specific elongation factor
MKHLIIGTAGHVDHGKTSLVKLLTGTDCDTHQQEKQRGITINLGFTHLHLPNGETAGIIDVPGHKDFINTMIGGACGIDMVLLVIAADSGIMPQTSEHVEIIRSLGITNGVVALTRADLVDAELLEMAEYEVASFLEGTPLQDAPIVAVSSVTGAGKEQLMSAIAQTLENVVERPVGAIFRMYIDRIFTVKGHGSVVTGSVLNGKLANGSELYLLPGDPQKLKVRSIERHGQPVQTLVAGDRGAINLTGLERSDFDRGMILCDKIIESTDMIDCIVTLFESAGTLPLWSNIVFISGTFACQARMHLIDKETITDGEEAIVQIHLQKPAVLLNRDRFIFRNSSEDKTLGGGIILETSPLHHRKRTPRLIEELQDLAKEIMGENSLAGMMHVLLKKAFRPMNPDEVRDKLSLSKEDVLEVLKAEHTGYIVYRDPEHTILINRHCDETYRKKISSALHDYHAKNPLLAGGMNLNELSGKLNLQKSSAGKHYLKLLLDKLVNDQILQWSNNTYILQGHQPQFDPKSMEEIAWIEQEILNCGDNKPVVSEIEELASKRKIPKTQFRAYLSWLVSQGKIRSYQSDIVHTELFARNRQIILDALENKRDGITIPELKEIVTGTKSCALCCWISWLRTKRLPLFPAGRRIRR